MATNQLYLIVSLEHAGQYWRAGSAGYTPNRAEAGLYSLNAAELICLNANKHGEINELMVPAGVDTETASTNFIKTPPRLYAYLSEEKESDGELKLGSMKINGFEFPLVSSSLVELSLFFKLFLESRIKESAQSLSVSIYEYSAIKRLNEYSLEFKNGEVYFND